jgi:hypothetical protein
MVGMTSLDQALTMVYLIQFLWTDIDKYKELSININVGVAENAHTLVDVTSDKVADKIFRQILLRIKSDELNIDNGIRISNTLSNNGFFLEADKLVDISL